MSRLALTTLALATTVRGQAMPSTGLIPCLREANVSIVVPGDPTYANESSTFNTHYQYSPAAIAVPATNEQAGAAVACAATNNVKVQAKGGGHSYASFSAGGQDGSLIVSMENFQDVTVDAAGVAAVGGGLRLGNMALALLNDSNRALPHGSCPGVGIGGHATHGGYGWASRNWGLTLDTIVGLDVVLANGSVAHAAADSNPDIFYALRGAADSFGIVTTFYMQTQPAPESLTYFSYSFGANNVLSGSGELAADMMMHVQDFAQNASVVDSRIGFGLYIDPTSFSWSGIFFGEQDDFSNRIKPELLRTMPPSIEDLRTVDWAGFVALIANGPVVTPTGSTYDEHYDFVATSILSPEASPITHDAWLAYFNYAIQNGNLGASNDWYSIVDHYGGPGSAINAVPADATSFSDRSALFDFQHFGFTNNMGAPFPPNIQPFIEGLNSAIPNAMPGVDFQQYVNYVDASLSATQAHNVYYGEPTYDRLLEIKQQLDPGLVYWNPQAVGVQ